MKQPSLFLLFAAMLCLLPATAMAGISSPNHINTPKSSVVLATGGQALFSTPLNLGGKAVTIINLGSTATDIGVYRFKIVTAYTTYAINVRVGEVFAVEGVVFELTKEASDKSMRTVEIYRQE